MASERGTFIIEVGPHRKTSDWKNKSGIKGAAQCVMYECFFKEKILIEGEIWQ